MLAQCALSDLNGRGTHLINCLINVLIAGAVINVHAGIVLLWLGGTLALSLVSGSVRGSSLVGHLELVDSGRFRVVFVIEEVESGQLFGGGS